MADQTWLREYYNRLQTEFQSSFTRRDNVTNWTYTLLAAILAIYFSFFSNNFLIEPIWRYSFILGMWTIMIRFFFQSMISYGYILRLRYLRTMIEGLWIENNPTYDTVINYIKTYDHGRKMPPTNRNRFWNGQVRSGYIINIIIPVILVLNELNLATKPLEYNYYLFAFGVMVYLALETLNFINYDQMKK